MPGSRIPVPDTITESVGEDGIVKLVRVWQPPRRGPLAVATFIWLWVIVITFALAGAAHIFPWLFVAGGLVIGYAAVSSWVNRSEYRFTETQVTTWSGPMPFVGHNHAIERADIRELLLTENNDSYGQPNGDFTLTAVDPSGRRRPVVARLETPHEALFLRQRFGELLEIEQEAISREDIDVGKP